MKILIKRILNGQNEAIALATNSVASNQFNPHPSAPRNFSALNDEMIRKKTIFFVTGALCIMMLS
jgi:hypothetical protein